MSDTRVLYKPYIIGGASTSFVVPAAVGGTTPPTIFGSALLGWYKNDVGLINNPTGPPVDGQAIGTWQDQSGNGLDLTGGAVGPLYQSAGYNGLPACVFLNSTGNTQMATATNAVSLGGQALSVFVVCQMAATAINNARLFVYVTTTTDFGDSTAVIALNRNGTGNAFSTFRNLSIMASQALATATNANIGMVFDGAGSVGAAGVTPYLNGVAGTQYTGAESTDTFGATGTFGLSCAYTGGSGPPPQSGFGWDGPVAEIVIVKAAATAAQVTSLNSYFVGRGF